MHRSTTKLMATVELFMLVFALYTQDGIEKQSSYTYFTPSFENLMHDNNFGEYQGPLNFSETSVEAKPWINIRLPESALIAAVFLFNR